MLITLSSLFGCQSSQINIINVERQKSGKVVYLTGQVTHLAPFVDNAAYQLQDSTGSIWVVTSLTPPKLHSNISIKGKIQYQSLSFAEIDLGEFYIIELQQLKAPVR
ncbi:MAG: DNA-binding protein [Pleurocapsa sp.]